MAQNGNTARHDMTPYARHSQNLKTASTSLLPMRGFELLSHNICEGLVLGPVDAARHRVGNRHASARQLEHRKLKYKHN